jgi:cytochrome P450
MSSSATSSGCPFAQEASKLASFDVFSPEHLCKPGPGWALLRQEAPVYRVNMPGPVPVFVVTRKKDIMKVARETDVFSSNPPSSIWRWGDFEPEIAEKFSEWGGRVALTLQASDPPQSIKYREIAERGLNAQRIALLEPEIDRIIEKLIAGMPDNAPFNFVDAFSVPLTLQMICLILGLPYSDAKFIKEFTHEFTHLVDPVHPHERALKAAEFVANGFKYIEEKIAYFTEHPADNLISIIAQAGIDGRPLSREERVSMAQVLIIAGNETTRNALSSAMYMLITRRDIRDRLEREPELMPEFIEEVLRLHAPATTTPRRAMRDTEIDGVAIPKGACLFVMWSSAGQDEAIFGNGQEFDLDRKNKRAHLSFGTGVHHCIGSILARAELNASVKAWFRHFSRVEFAVPESQVRYDPVFGFHSLSELPVRITRR